MSTSRIDSSASGFTPISSSACRATARIASVSTSTPDSLAISMDMWCGNPRESAPPPGAATTGGTAGHGMNGLLLLAGVEAGVGVDDLAHQPVPDDVGAGELREVHVLDVAEDLPHHPQAARGAAGEVDLGDVASHNDLGAETEPGQEHLHLLGRGVLRLVQDDERVVQRPAAHVRERRDLDRSAFGQTRVVSRLEHLVERVV